MFGFVVLFGLLHALFFLPICLSIMGPLQPDDETTGGRERGGENGREMQRFIRAENNVDAAEPNGVADQMAAAV